MYTMFRQTWICLKWMNFLYWFYRYYDQIQTDSECSRQLKDKLISLGCLGIKLGQYLCNRPDIITTPMKDQLSSLLSHNRIHPRSFSLSVLASVSDELELGEVIGSGSMAQVYRCTYQDDPNCVIKINHPEVQHIPDEIQALRYVLYVLRCFPRFCFLRNMDWDDFFKSIVSQMDMTNEALSMLKFSSLFASMKDISVPTFLKGTRDYIIMSYCEGRTLNHFERTDPIYQKAHNLFVCAMIHGFTRRLVHGDVHEGNILVKPDGSISIIDFGLCIRVSVEQMNGFLSISKFELNPTYENCEKIVRAIIHNKTITNDDILIPELSRECFRNYQHTRGLEIDTFFTVLTSLAHKYNVIIRSNIMTYFMNAILMESLAPFKEKQNVSNIIAMAYMKRENYLTQQNRSFIEEYYQVSLEKTPSHLIEKYNLRVE